MEVTTSAYMDEDEYNRWLNEKPKEAENLKKQAEKGMIKIYLALRIVRLKNACKKNLIKFETVSCLVVSKMP